MKQLPIRKVLVLFVGTLFTGYGSIAILVSIPHASPMPILVALSAVIAGIGAIVGASWSRYLFYFVSAVYAFAWFENLIDLRKIGMLGGSMREIGLAILPGAIVVAILILSCLVVGLYFRSNVSDT